MSQETAIGGQALIEGVMMRGKDHYTLALRKESGEIKLINQEVKSLSKKFPIIKKPFFRGAIALIESLIIGTKSLIISANEALPEDEKEEKSQKMDSLSIFFMVLTSFLLGMGIFVAVPNVATEAIGIKETANPILFNLIAGFIRMTIFIIYVYSISLMNDVKRVFQYHGAEHKSVNAYEAGVDLTLDNAKSFPTYHPRCGTSFMFFVLFISIFIFALVPVVIIHFFPTFTDLHIVLQKLVLIPSHILLLPVVASVSYEVLKLTSKHQGNPIFRLFSLPGYYIQKLTTKEPDDDQVEVALAALKEVIKLGEEAKEEVKVPESVLAGETA